MEQTAQFVKDSGLIYRSGTIVKLMSWPTRGPSLTQDHQSNANNLFDRRRRRDVLRFLHE
jgi:hypothetical protein